ncbi:MAG TPA: thioredoxin domain-containing protein, partial [Terriglobales bacterium]|nr:thioredoxin domain-containing protein [Terriglobales bacterium]
APKFPHPAVLDLLIDQYGRSGDESLREAFVTTLEKMAHGGVYDQLAGGFHRYSVDERWIVPHFEKMCYDNSELLKNYVHAYQATGSELFAAVARDIMRWMDEWLSDREHGGFYASQDADYSMDDDGDYFTWTVKETDEVLTEEESAVAKLHYDINEVGEMHHNPEKNVLYVRASVEEISTRLKLSLDRVQELLRSAKEKMYAARLKRPTPYVDKTIYVGWNALCVSAYLDAAKVLDLESARRFALRSLDRILSKGWNNETGLSHVIAYSDSIPVGSQVSGLLDDYAFTAVACLDAYESTSDITYFNFARQIGDAMVSHFFDETSGGFFDTSRGNSDDRKSLGVLATQRKPFQDSPTPAGNSVAAIALLRLYGYTNDREYEERAERTMEVLGGLAGQYGIFAATYAIAGVYFSAAHTQIAILGKGDKAEELYKTAVKDFRLGKAVVRFETSQAVAHNLPRALAETIPELSVAGSQNAMAIICSNFTCQPPISSPEEMDRACKDLSRKREPVQ